MVNKKLAEWIKSEEAQGYSEQQLRDYLLKKKYNKKEVEDAIALSKEHRKFNFKEFIKPTPLKLFVPVLFLILIIITFFVNSVYAPELGEKLCNIISSAQEYQDQNSKMEKSLQKFDANPNEIIQQLESKYIYLEKQMEIFKDLSTIFKPLLLGNMYFYPTMIYKLNPFFPVACEWNSFESGISSSLRCSYYINKESYNCITNIKNDQENPSGGFGGLLSGSSEKELPKYKKINFIDFLFNTILLGAIIFIIVCLTTYLFSVLKFKNDKKKILIVLLLLIIPAVSLFLGFPYPIFFYPLIILFSILLFIKNKKTQTKIIYILSSVLLLLLVVGIFVANFAINNTLERQATNSFESPQFKAIYCNNTKEFTAEELNKDPAEIPTGTTLKMCHEPPCGKICKNYCQSVGKDSYQTTEVGVGNNPFCVCGC